MFENEWLSGQMHPKSIWPQNFFWQTYQYEYKKHELYPDFKFVDAGVKKCVKKS
jgi:hypothetical protein